MEWGELNKIMLTMDLNYKQEIIDAELTRMIQARSSAGLCNLVRAVHWVKDVDGIDEPDVVSYHIFGFYNELEYVGSEFLGHNFFNAKKKFIELTCNNNWLLNMKRRKDERKKR